MSAPAVRNDSWLVVEQPDKRRDQAMQVFVRLQGRYHEIAGPSKHPSDGVLNHQAVVARHLEEDEEGLCD